MNNNCSKIKEGWFISKSARHLVTILGFVLFADDSEEPLGQEFAVILTKLLCSKARKVFLQWPDIVKLIVSRILVSL